MRNYHLLLLWCGVGISISKAASLQEDFASDPAARGWHVFGQTNLFQWNRTNQSLQATWDSSQRNSFFYRRLGTVLTKSDDFSLVFDLRLSDIAVGVHAEKSSTFELAVGFLNLAGATSANFERDIGIDAASGPRNLAEFDYFPDSGFGATISPTMVSSNNQFAVGFDFPLELKPGNWFHVTMTFTADNRTLATVMRRDGQPFGPIQEVKLDAAFTDFRLDALAVSSYSDAGADGSILAHGAVDNLLVTTPEPPIVDVTAGLTNGALQLQFASRAGWLYTLERTDDFHSWSNVSSATPGVKGRLALSDTNALDAKAYYRVRAERP